MENLMIEIMNNYGYIGIGLLIFIENLFPPIPSEVILTFGGFMTTTTKMSIPRSYCGLYYWFFNGSHCSVFYRKNSE